MQNAKDSFYIALRDRLALLNPARVITLRGTDRPAILVEESESPTGEAPIDAYVIRWTQIAATVAPGLVSMLCEIRYTTSGSQNYAGLDRGRRLAELDCELKRILTPTCAPKLDFATTPAAILPTAVFWAEPVLLPIETVREQLRRVALVTIFAFEDDV